MSGRAGPQTRRRRPKPPVQTPGQRQKSSKRQQQLPGWLLPSWQLAGRARRVGYSARTHAFCSANLTTRRLVGPTCRPLKAWMAVWACRVTTA